jgi:hypothetical protein
VAAQYALTSLDGPAANSFTGVAPLQYYSSRTGSNPAGGRFDLATLKRLFLAFYHDLLGQEQLQEFLGKNCEDSMRNGSQIILGALVCACFSGSGCTESSAPVTPQLSGTFALTMVDNKILPDTEAITPRSSPGTPPGLPGQPTCVILGSSGSLRLDRVTGKFLITLNARNSCLTDEWVLLTEVGTYSQDGPTLLLLEPLGTGTIGRFAGQIAARSVAVQGAYRAYTFAR